MGTITYSITSTLQKFIEAQPVFFVATAPINAESFINLSPKGLDTFRILNSQQVAYLDLAGSGNETATHLKENGRITFMFCSFGQEPMILRLFGYASVIEPGSPEWSEYQALFPTFSDTRQFFTARISRVQTSCGFGVPLMDYVKQRETL